MRKTSCLQSIAGLRPGICENGGSPEPPPPFQASCATPSRRPKGEGCRRHGVSCLLGRTWPMARAVALLCVDPRQSSATRKVWGLGWHNLPREGKGVEERASDANVEEATLLRPWKSCVHLCSSLTIWEVTGPACASGHVRLCSRCWSPLSSVLSTNPRPGRRRCLLPSSGSGISLGGSKSISALQRDERTRHVWLLSAQGRI